MFIVWMYNRLADYNHVLHMFAFRRQPSLAFCTYDDIKAVGLQADAYTYSGLLNACAKVSPDGLMSSWALMRSNLSTYMLLKGSKLLTECRRWHRLNNLLTTLIESMLRGLNKSSRTCCKGTSSQACITTTLLWTARRAHYFAHTGCTL